MLLNYPGNKRGTSFLTKKPQNVLNIGIRVHLYLHIDKHKASFPVNTHSSPYHDSRSKFVAFHLLQIILWLLTLSNVLNSPFSIVPT